MGDAVSLKSELANPTRVRSVCSTSGSTVCYLLSGILKLRRAFELGRNASAMKKSASLSFVMSVAVLLSLASFGYDSAKLSTPLRAMEALSSFQRSGLRSSVSSTLISNNIYIYLVIPTSTPSNPYKVLSSLVPILRILLFQGILLFGLLRVLLFVQPFNHILGLLHQLLLAHCLINQTLVSCSDGLNQCLGFGLVVLGYP